MNQRSLDALMDGKESSVGDWASLELAGQPILRVVKNRTSILMAPGEGLVVRSEIDGEVMRVSFSNPLALEGGEAAEVGCAVAVSADGYFVTAAHCLEGAQPALIVFNVRPDGTPEVIKSDWRVVWKSPDYRECDLAIIHAPLRPSQFFMWRAATDLMKDEAVALTGVSGIGFGSPPRRSDAAGRVLRVSDPTGVAPGPVWRTVLHDAPMSAGDSGGPLVDRQGRLVAVNSLARVRRVGQWFHARSPQGLGYVGESVAPDLEWLASVIEADRKSRR